MDRSLRYVDLGIEMKAIVNEARGAEHIVFKKIKEPTPAPEEVKVRVRAAGVCGTDIHIWRGLYRTTPPLVIGHEFSGEIVELGERVEGWQVGQRVVAENTTGACGVCALCRSGGSHICKQKRAYGTDRDGCMAEYFCVPARSLHLLPDSISFEEASILEPLAVVNRALMERAHVQGGDRVVVLGAGAIGLLSVQVAKANGASQIVLVGTDLDVPFRFGIAERIGASHLLNVGKTDVVQDIHGLFGGEGADLVVEASGAEKAVSTSLDVVGIGKRIVAIGLVGRPVTCEWDKGVFKEIDLLFSKSSTYMSWHRAISMVADGSVNLRELIQAEFPLEQWSEAFLLMENGNAVKSILKP